MARDEYVFRPQKWAMIFKLTLRAIILLFPFFSFSFFKYQGVAYTAIISNDANCNALILFSVLYPKLL